MPRLSLLSLEVQGQWRAWTSREAHFNSPEAQFDVAERKVPRAIDLQIGGCYDEVITGPAVDRERLFCIEYFPADSATPPADVMRR